MFGPANVRTGHFPFKNNMTLTRVVAHTFTTATEFVEGVKTDGMPGENAGPFSPTRPELTLIEAHTVGGMMFG